MPLTAAVIIYTPLAVCVVQCFDVSDAPTSEVCKTSGFVTFGNGSRTRLCVISTKNVK
jgi:hypothetical protein